MMHRKHPIVSLLRRFGWPGLLAVLLLFSLAACGGNELPEASATPTLIPTLDASAGGTIPPSPDTATEEEEADEEAAESADEEADDAAAADETADDEAGDGELEATEEATATVESEAGAGVAEAIDVFFVEPEDGATVPVTFTVVMSATGVQVQPAGEVVEGAGHLHLLVDTDFVDAGEMLPADEEHIHFGDASLESELSLEPGEHTLRLQFADGEHVALEGDEFRDEITVTVEDTAEEGSEEAAADAEADDQEAADDAEAEEADAAEEGEVEEEGEAEEVDEVEASSVTTPEATVEAGMETDQEVDVFFVEPEDGATVSLTFSVVMSATGVQVEPSGEVAEGAGHMHIMVDTDFVPASEVILSDAAHLHFGDASLETELSLEPGEHTLRLQFADGEHVALEGDEYRDEITVTVEEDE